MTTTADSAEKSGKRIVLIRTYKRLLGGDPVPPLGLLYLASSLRRRFGNDLDIRLIDTGVTPIDQAVKQVVELRPDYVGLSSLSCEHDQLRLLTHRLRNDLPGAKLIVGGPHAQTLGSKLLKLVSADFAVLGEGEHTLVELIEALEAGGDPSAVKGMAWRDGKQILTTGARTLLDDLDSLPPPAWDLINFDDYVSDNTWAGITHHKRYALLLTSRGCPYSCYYCHNIFGRKVRAHSTDRVMAEIRTLYQSHGIREFHIIDDIFNYNRERALEICERISAEGLKISLCFPNGMRPDLMDRELIRALKNAGAYKINYGFESLDDDTQGRIEKKLDISRAQLMIDATARAGIITGAYFMFGFPRQSESEMRRTLEYASRSALDGASFFKATPYPGSAFHREVVADAGPDGEEQFDEYHFFSTRRAYGDLDEVRLNALLLEAQRRFYLRPLRFVRGLIKTSRRLAYLRKSAELLAMIIYSRLIEMLAGPTPEPAEPERAGAA